MCRQFDTERTVVISDLWINLSDLYPFSFICDRKTSYLCVKSSKNTTEHKKLDGYCLKSETTRRGASIKDLQIADTHNAFSDNSKNFIHILEIV